MNVCSAITLLARGRGVVAGLGELVPPPPQPGRPATATGSKAPLVAVRHARDNPSARVFALAVCHPPSAASRLPDAGRSRASRRAVAGEERLEPGHDLRVCRREVARLLRVGLEVVQPRGRRT